VSKRGWYDSVDLRLGVSISQLNTTYRQTGLSYFPDYAIYASFFVQERGLEIHTPWQALARDVEDFCEQKRFGTVMLRGVGFELWKAWTKAFGQTVPRGMGDCRGLDGRAPALSHSGGDLWFHIKPDSQEDAQALPGLRPTTSRAGERPLRHPAPTLLAGAGRSLMSFSRLACNDFGHSRSGPWRLRTASASRMVHASILSAKTRVRVPVGVTGESDESGE
jgi:hypothetical protein